MIAYQRLRAEGGRAGDKNTLQGLLYCPRCVRPFCVGSAASFNYSIVFCLHVLENNDTSGLKISWHLSLANFHMKRELDKWLPRWGPSAGPWNKHRTRSHYLPKRYIIIYNHLGSCGLNFSYIFTNASFCKS